MLRRALAAFGSMFLENVREGAMTTQELVLAANLVER
jgi:hypothetical protein